MAIKLEAHLADWTARAVAFLEAHNLTIEDVKTGANAWTVAHKTRITMDAYDISRDIVDAHIQSALERIFPCAVFKDAKRY